MATREDYELELIKAQTALALQQSSLTFKQAKTEFWKVGIATAAAGAVVGGFIATVL
jgi:hypothetical protein